MINKIWTPQSVNKTTATIKTPYESVHIGQLIRILMTKNNEGLTGSLNKNGQKIYGLGFQFV